MGVGVSLQAYNRALLGEGEPAIVNCASFSSFRGGLSLVSVFSRPPRPEGKAGWCVRGNAEGISAGWHLSVRPSLDSWIPLGDTTRPQAQPWPQTHGGHVIFGYVTAEGTSFWAGGARRNPAAWPVSCPLSPCRPEAPLNTLMAQASPPGAGGCSELALW